MRQRKSARSVERRSDYARRVTACLAASAIHARAWPQDRHQVVYVGYGASGIVIEFEPDIPLDLDASWTARILVPGCCRRDRNHGEAVETPLDETDCDGSVVVQGARVAEVAAHAAQAWADHAAKLHHSAHPTEAVSTHGDLLAIGV